MGYLAYQIQRVERNKYITAMLIYTSIVLNMYVRMLYFVYREKGHYDGLPEPTANKESTPVSSPTRTTSVNRQSSQTAKS